MKVIQSRSIICKTRKEIRELISYIKQTKVASFDFETDGNPFQDQTSVPTVLGFSFQIGSSYVIPLAHYESPFLEDDEWIDILHELGREIFMNPDIIKIAQNIAFEIKWLKKYGIEIIGRMFDTMYAHYLLDENVKHGLKLLVALLIPSFGDYEDENDKLVKKYGWARVPLDRLCHYNGLDCDMTLRLMVYFHEQLIKANMYQLFRNLLMMAVRVLSESEFHGIPVDRSYLEKTTERYGLMISDEIEALKRLPIIRRYTRKSEKAFKKAVIKSVKDDIKKIIEKGEKNSATLIANRQQKVLRMLRGEFKGKKEIYTGMNFNSVPKMVDLFYDSDYGFDLPVLDVTDSGNPSTGEKTLLKLAVHKETGAQAKEFIKGLLKIRGLQKLHSTYMVGILEKLSADDKLHASYHLLTTTGRLGCRKPNMQNIPRMLTCPDVKPMFVAPRGKLQLEVDYSQAELRVVAEMANDAVMIDMFKRGYSIHVATAAAANGQFENYDKIRKIIKDESHPENEFWERQKKKAKTINFGILYGQGDDKLAEGMGTPVKEAAEFRQAWIKTYPDIAWWINNQKVIARKNGFVMTLFGRKRRLPDIWSENRFKRAEAERQSVNAPIQSAASDFTQLSSIVIRDKRLRGELPRDLIQKYTVHDSLGYHLSPEDISWVKPKIVEICSNPDTEKYFGFKMKHVNMKVEAEVGKNWGAIAEHDDNFDYSTLLEDEEELELEYA
jgi:DNA polymerase-1